MKLLSLVYYFVCPLSILSFLEFRGASLAQDAHSVNTVMKRQILLGRVAHARYGRRWRKQRKGMKGGGSRE